MVFYTSTKIWEQTSDGKIHIKDVLLRIEATTLSGAVRQLELRLNEEMSKGRIKNYQVEYIKSELENFKRATDPSLGT